MKYLARLYIDHPLSPGATFALAEAQAHYLLHVMRAEVGAHLRVFNGKDGEWSATLTQKRKHDATLELGKQLREQRDTPECIVCFAPPRGGRIDSIIEKATELGASALQPVRTQFSVVDKINEEKWLAAVREAAEQCERMDLPEIRPMITLPQLLGAWQDIPLIYGDESGASPTLTLEEAPAEWGVLIGPEGGFSHDERALIARVKAARGVSLGPRILRTDTAVITLLALTMHAWGDWNHKPHFQG